ncbi:type II toxin-antitoxin system RelE/ParE family toxin [Salegentibacter salegens]|uniref:Plasmid stabilization system protein ParE n=1 Tax=Salegentibacter salegens TaxID=143223 RepID=A0A1M7MRN0_9FLAO|nr:type II toxin-antitoxin system RelE/ParE family toxin [Salegentibacter salegens]PRX52560.1 plasmid stabilization system protein ParE [Salegentibacter salegens]SHM93613.1 Plasmid stabilization system protein ParE [Salegentibacter salegens]
MAKFRIIWSSTAKLELQKIHDYFKFEKKTPQGAKSIIQDILKATKEITFPAQYQIEETNPKYRRIVIRHYKIIYKEENNNILILRIFDSRQSPEKLHD